MLLHSTLRCRLPLRGQLLPRRSLFNLPDISSFSPFNSGPEVQKFQERKVLPYSKKELYDVVSDVASYPQFLPFCIGTRIMRPLAPEAGSSHQVSMEAKMTVGFLSFEESYVSKVTCSPNESVQAVATSSTPLFRTLSTTWSFQPSTLQVEPESTLVTLDLAYAFASPVHAGVSGMFFGQVSQLMVQAFEDRCKALYGARNH